MAKRAKKVKVIGQCTVCGCTDDHGCELGCAWANAEHTLCSLCSNVQWRTDTGRPGREPKEIPVYGIWCEHGGPDGRGYWMCESGVDDFEHPALYWRLKDAMKHCKRENDPSVDGSLAQDGWSCVVVELVATRIVRP